MLKVVTYNIIILLNRDTYPPVRDAYPPPRDGGRDAYPPPRDTYPPARERDVYGGPREGGSRGGDPYDDRRGYAPPASSRAYDDSEWPAMYLNNPLFLTVPMSHLQPINCFVPASLANSKCVSRSAAILLSNFIKKTWLVVK